MKFRAADECFYGQVWRRQKDVYIARNEAGQYVEQAAQKLAAHKFGKDTTAFARTASASCRPRTSMQWRVDTP